MNDEETKAIVADIRRVAAGRKAMSRAEYLQEGRYSEYQLYDGGRTWDSLCHAANVRSKRIEPVPDEVYFRRLAIAVKQLGRYPKVSERKHFGLNFSKRRYPTLAAFIRRAVDAGEIPDLFPSPPQAPPRVDLPSQPASAGAERRVPPIPRRTGRRKWQRTAIYGFPYAPQDELGVVALFAILCSNRTVPWQILELRGGKGIDATCFDESTGQELRVELKFRLSRTSWNHRIEDLDYVVCWENRWPDFPKPVVELSRLVHDA